MHKVNRPPLIGASDRRDRRAPHVANLAFAACADLKLKRLVQPTKAELADRCLASEHDQQATPAKSGAFRCEQLGAIAKFTISLWERPVKQRPTWLPDDDARASLRNTSVLQGPHRFLPLRGPQPFFEIRSFTASSSIV